MRMQHRPGVFLCATSVFLRVSVVQELAEISTTEALRSTEVAQRKLIYGQNHEVPDSADNYPALIHSCRGCTNRSKTILATPSSRANSRQRQQRFVGDDPGRRQSNHRGWHVRSG